MNYFYENRISAYMLFGGLIILGIIGFSRTPISLLPRVTYPGISIIIEYPGTTPDKVETVITKPVEKIIKTVPGIEKIDSVSEEGQSRINVNFKINTDIKLSTLQVREKIGIIRSSFPKEVEEPTVVRYDPTDKPVLIATVDIPGCTLYDVRDFAERKIKPRLQRIEGISEINIAGGSQKEIHIDIDNARFNARSLDYNQLYEVVQNSNISLPGGRITINGMEYNIFTSQKFHSVSDIARTAFYPGSTFAAIEMSDFSEVGVGWREKDDFSRFNGEEKVTLYIHKASDANILSVCEKSVSILHEIPGTKAKVIYNQGDHVKSSLLNVVKSCCIGALLIIVILYAFFRRLDCVAVILISIPVSILSSFLFLYYMGIEIDMMSLSGITLGTSIVVDNGIVIISSIYSGKSVSKKNIVSSVSSLKNAISISTISTLVVFFPILFSSEQTRQMYQGLAYTIAIVLLVSLLVMLILLPVVLIDLNRDLFGKYRLSIPQGVTRLKSRIDARLNKLEYVRIGFLRNYRLFLGWAFDNSYQMSIAIVIITGLAILASFTIKKEIVDPMSSGEFYLYIEFPSGTPIEATNDAVISAEKVLRDMKVAEKVTVKVEKWRGTLTVKLYDKFDSDKKREGAKNRIKTALSDAMKPKGGFVFLSEAEESNARELDITVLGNDNERIKEIAKECAKKISGIKGIDDVVLRFREGRPEYKFILDREKANFSGFTSADIGNFLRTSLYGPVVSKYVDVDKEIDIRMKISPEYTQSPDALKRLQVNNSNGTSVPLAELSTLEEAEGDTKIWRLNGKRCATITAKIGNISYDDAVTLIDEAFGDISWPEDYTYQYDDIIKSMHETNRSMFMALSLAILLVFMILASKFESFCVPFVIMVSLPVSFIGVIAVLLLFGKSLNLSVYIGLIMLIGIAVNNGIVLVDRINHVYVSGKMKLNTLRNIIEAESISRIKPVTITALTTIFAMLPALFRGGDGSNLWRPLSLTVISGIVFSYCATLVIIPVFCKIVYGFKLKRA